MTTPIGSFQGLASGIQWRDLVDQIITLETARALNPITTAISQENDRIGALLPNLLQGIYAVLRFHDAKVSAFEHHA